MSFSTEPDSPLREPIAVVNERSLPPFVDDLSVETIPILLSKFVEMSQALREIRPDLSLASATPLGSLPITPEGSSFGSIAMELGGRPKEDWRHIQSRRNKAPFSISPSLIPQDPGEEYRIAGESCVGLGVASGSEQLAVSFATSATWDAHEIELLRVSLVEDDVTGDLLERSEDVCVKHASHPVHVETNRAWIAELALPQPFSGADLWLDRETLYPHLVLLPRVKSQLRAFDPGSATMAAVHERLTELSSSAGAWDPITSTFPVWKSDVTPESASRKHLCYFADDDGVDHCFHLHARFTPGKGRIHLRLDTESQALRIAHVGPKL